MLQPDLFTTAATLAVTGPAEAKPRLSRQALAILARLQRGPASNRDLCSLSLKYTGRISDLRANGYQVECFGQNHKTGEAWYRLSSPDVQAPPHHGGEK